MSKPRQETEHSRKRRNKERQETDLRSKIQFSHIQRQLAMVEELIPTMESSDVAKYRLLADIQFRKLSKILPDLKSIELGGDSDNPVNIIFTALDKDI